MQVQRTAPIHPELERAFRTASERTGTSFDYLVATAYRESSFRPELKATTSSATGLFQFIEQQWLELVKQEGPALGLGAAAAAITERGGRYAVADPATRQQILDLRHDPAIASVMAGRVTARNEASLARSLGRTPTEQDLYVAHVLGATGGARLIRMVAETPEAAAATAFPVAAAANRPIFYDRDGTPRSAADVYAFLARGHRASPLPGETAALRRQAPGVTPAAAADRLRADLAAGIGSQAAPAKTAVDASDGAAAAAAGRLEGWRARRPSDAFSGLMRTDSDPVRVAAATGTAGAGVLGYAGAGRSGEAGTLAARMAAIAAGGATATAVRPSRLVAARVAGGAPAAPLPMVTGPLGVARPSRFSMAALIGVEPAPASAAAAAIAAGAARPMAPKPAAATVLAPLDLARGLR